MSEAPNFFDRFGFDDGGTGNATSEPNEEASGAPLTVTRHAPAAPNFFDKYGFDDGSPPAAPPIVSPHSGLLANDPKGDGWISSDVKGSSTAAIKGASHWLGFGGDLHAGLGYGEDWIEGKFTGETPEQVGARRAAATQAAQERGRNADGIGGAVSRGAQALTPPEISGHDISDRILAKTGEYVPQTEIGRLGMAGVEAGVGGIGPAGGGVVAGTPARTIADTAARSALPLMASGVTGEGVTEATHSPMAGMVAGIAVPAAGHVVGRGTGYVGDGVRNYIAPMEKMGRQQPVLMPDGKPFLDETGQPFTATGSQAALAGGALADASTDPQAVRAQLAGGTHEIVPGSAPTTFQQTGDPGLGQLERKVATQNPDRFLSRAADQNSARVEHMATLQPSGSPVDVANSFRAIRDEMDAAHAQSLAEAHQARGDAVRAVGGQGSTAESVGRGARDPLVQARAATKDNEDRLWGLVNQDGGVPASSIAKTAQDIQKGVSPSATQMSGEEARIFDVAAGYPATQRFGDLKDLRSSITDATAAARQAGNTQAVRRLGMLRSALDDALDHGVENQAALDQIAVKRGVMAPEDTMEARIRQLWSVPDAAANVVGDASGYRTGNRGPSARSSSAPLGGSGADVSTRGGFRPAPSNPRVSEEAPQFSAEDVAYYRAATAATRERAQTFDEGPVGRVLQKARRGGFERPDSLVGKQVFHPGPNGGEDLRAYLKAGGTHEAATEAAAHSLRQAALRDDGTFDAPAVSSWIRGHEPALRELPADVRQRFEHSIHAQDAYDSVVADQKAQQNDLKRSAAGPFLGLTEPESITRHVGSIFGQKNAVETFGDLARRTADDPAARDGLRRAVVDHIKKKFFGSEAGTSEVPQIKAQRFIDFFRENAPALRKLFTEEEAGKISAISQDLERAQRSAKTKLPAGSNTAQDMLLTRPYDTNRSILSNIATSAARASGGYFLAGPIGALTGWLGPRTVGALRQAGLTRVDNLVTEAMLNPDLAKALLRDAPKIRDTEGAVGLAFRAKQLAALQAQSQGRQQRSDDSMH